MSAQQDLSLDPPVSCPPEADSVWISVSDLARAKGVEKSSISRRIKRLEEQGLIHARLGPGGQKLVKLAAYDRATGEATDAIREANGSAARIIATRRGIGVGLSAQQARRVAYQADLAELDLAERRGHLLVAENVRAAVADAAATIAAQIERLPERADDLADVVAKRGVQGARSALRGFVDDLMAAIAEQFKPVGAPLIEPWAPLNSAERVAEIDAKTADRWAQYDARYRSDRAEDME